MERTSPVANCHNGINVHRTTRRQITTNKSYREEKYCNDSKREQIYPVDSIEKAPQVARQPKRDTGTDHSADRSQEETLPGNHL